VSWEQSSKEWF